MTQRAEEKSGARVQWNQLLLRRLTFSPKEIPCSRAEVLAGGGNSPPTVGVNHRARSSPPPPTPTCVSSLLFTYDKRTFDIHYNTDTVF